MQRRGFIVLLTATVIVVAAAIVVLATGDRTASPAPAGERELPGLAAKLGDLAWVGLSRGPTKIDFAAVNGSWAVVEKGNYPAAQAKMRQLLLGLADLTLVEPKTERPELFARLDLDDPANGKATDLKLNDRIGQTVAELVVGKRRADRIAITASGQDAAEAEAKAINAKVGGWSYAVTPDRAKLLRTRLADLVEPPKGS